MKRSFTNRQLAALLLPLMAEQVLASIMGTVDTMMVSNAGEAAVSAVSLVDSLNVLLVQVFSAMATGGAVVCSQLIGSGDMKEATESGRQLQLSICALATVIGAAGILLRRPLLSLLFGSVENQVMEGCLTYFIITALSYPALAFYSGGAAIFRSLGNSKLPLYVSLLSNLINIVGNAVLIYGFHMGVMGVALPTLASRLFSGGVMLWELRRPRQAIVLKDWRKARFSWPRIACILRIGVPNGVENGMFQFGKLIIQSTISTMGTSAIAANAIAAQLEAFSSQAANGVCLGATTVVGQVMGAGKKEEAKFWVKRLTLIGWVCTLILSGVMVLICPAVTQLACLSAESAALAIWMNQWIHGYKIFTWAFGFVPPAAMRAAGDVKFSMITVSLIMWLCRVVIVMFLANTYHLGPICMWIGMFTDWTVRAVVFYLRYRSGKWLEHDVLRTK